VSDAAPGAALGLGDLFVASGGIGLVILGMSTMSDGLKELGGTAIRDLVAKAGRMPLRGWAVGAAASAAMQTSSSTVLAAMGFAAAGMLTTLEAIPIVAGATVGTTTTTWLVATAGASPQVSRLILPLILVGALLHMLGRGPGRRAGLFLAGLGTIFMGLYVLKGSLGPLVEHVDLHRIDGTSIPGRLLLAGVGLALAALFQSSAAAIALAMTALAAGSLGFAQAAPMVVGASVGTTSTAAIAMVATGPASRRVGLAWIATAALAAAIALVALGPFEAAAAAIADHRHASATVALAIFHTIFATVGAVTVLLLRRRLDRRLVAWVPDRVRALGLDPSLRSVPPAAIEAARRAIAAVAADMVGASRREIALGTAVPPALAEEAKESGRAIDLFLRSVDRASLGPDDAEQQVTCLQALEHLRAIRKLEMRGSLLVSAREPELAGPRESALAASDAALDWLRAPSGPSPGPRLVESAVRMAGERGAVRARVIARLTRREIDPLAADVALDGLRSLDEYLTHLSRLVVDLDRGLESPVTVE